jgi:DNA-binding CsgD family transcriptional regulator
VPWLGREAETRELCVAILRARSVLPPAGSLIYAATRTLAVLDLAAGHYAAALELLHNLYEDDPYGYREPATLPDMVEAGIRGGDRPFASRALRHLEAHVRIKPTPWGLGVLACSRALHTTDEDPERLYIEALPHLREPGAAADVARAHLLFGEWLRRQKRRVEARSHLRPAHDLFVDVGAGGFAGRAAAELVATGEQARRRTVDTQYRLTGQELHIASLAAAHATNREIAQQMFISARTVEYHLHNAFQKLRISSRRQLSTALTQVSGVVGLNRLELGEAG